MIRYILKRILWLIPVIIGVSLIVFTLMELTPGTVVDKMISESTTEEELQALKAQYNLDKPMLYRYGLYMYKLVQGDLGKSDVNGFKVWDLFIKALPNTLVLVLAGLIVGAGISVPLGIFASRRAGTIWDTLATLISLLGISMPSFWVGILMLMLFSQTLGWLPSGGTAGGFKAIILPAICTGFLFMATNTRQTRSSMLEVLKSDFLRTARAKGVPENMVIRKHALGNALIPILTTMGTGVSTQLSGSIVIESVFSWPGIGRLSLDAVQGRDTNLVLGCVIMTTILYVLVLLLVDLLYATVDPRIKALYVNMGRGKKRAKAVPEAQAPAECASIAVEPLPWQPTEGYQEAVAVKKHEVLPPSLKWVKQNAVSSAAANQKKHKQESRLSEALRRMRKNRSAIIGMILIGFILAVFVYSLTISFNEIAKTDIANKLQAPSWAHLFGTDNFGRDMLKRVFYGTRYSLAIGIGAAGFAAIIGIFIGAISGFYGGKIDDVIMRLADILASIPTMLLGMVLVLVMGQNLHNLIIAVGITCIPIYIRITRATMLTVKNNEYVEAAKAMGLSKFRTIFTQVLPNGLAPLIVTFTTNIGMTILSASALSFLGFGVPLPAPEWGVLISAGRDITRVAPWLMIFPGLFIMITVLGFNLLGDGLRDALDPKMKK